MMTPCKGIHRIVCTMAGGCPRKLKNIQPDCISCPEAVTQILDLEGKLLYEHRVFQSTLEETAQHSVPNKKRKGNRAKRFEGKDATMSLNT